MIPKSFKLVWKSPYPHSIVLTGFPSRESAENYNKEFYMEPEGSYKTLCYVMPDFDLEPSRDEFGNFV